MANPHFQIFRAFSIRYLILLPIAFCLYVLIISNDMNIRFASVVALVVLAQVRDITLLSTARGLAKGK
jgi:hypothetical protein